MGLERLRRSAGLVDGRKDGRVGLGVTVGYVDLRTENTARLKVVGYAPVAGAAVIADGEVRRVSIAAPISQLLDGAAVGDVVEGALGSRRARLRITDVTRD
jgi:transcription elongation GreA/GreB family factor